MSAVSFVGSALDCRPGDTNRNGVLDAADVGCIPVGMSLGQLRPINLALNLLVSAGWTPDQPDHGIAVPAPPVTDTPALIPISTPPPPETPTPSLTPTPETADLSAYLPASLPLAQADCFRVEQDGSMTLSELADRLGGTAEDASRLAAWGWQASSYRVFACDEPPSGETGWIEINVHLFGDAASARQAVDYFAGQRAEGSFLMTGAAPQLGDHAVALSGPAWNGEEFTVYFSRGPLLFRVTGVSTSGIPFSNVLTIARALLSAHP